jgi:hypothetical protein
VQQIGVLRSSHWYAATMSLQRNQIALRNERVARWNRRKEFKLPEFARVDDAEGAAAHFWVR